MQAYDAYWVAALFIGLSVIVVNLIVVATFYRHRERVLRRKVNRLLLSLAFADLLVGIFCLILASCLLSNQEQYVYKTVGNIPLFGSLFASILSLSLLSFDRIVAIAYPLRYRSIVTGKRIALSLAVGWLFSLSMCIQQYCFLYGYSPNFELKARGNIMIVCFFVGSTILIISNALLYKALKEQFLKFAESERSFHAVEQCSDDLKELEMPKRAGRRLKRSELAASKECLYIVFVFICCYLPLSTYRIVFTYGVALNDINARRLCLLLALLSSFINPWIYFFKRRQFRRLLARNPSIVDDEVSYP